MYNILDYLEKTSEKSPTKIAIKCLENTITYEEFVRTCKKGGSFLANKIGMREPVCIFMEKGIDTLIAFFSTVYAGCFYSLINPEFPENRILDIVHVLESKIVLTDDAHEEVAKKIFRSLEVVNVRDLKSGVLDEEKLEYIRNLSIDCDPLYVNFTSGSTGIPKGVAISHRSVIDFIGHFTKLFHFTENDIIANQAPFDFDVSVKDIYSAFQVGATLLIVPKEYFSAPAKLLDYLVDNKATTLTWAVSALCLVTTFHGLDYKVPKDVDKVIFSGEVMPMKHLREWMEKLPDATFINVYGPTEITCNCTYHVIDRNRDYEVIPIGKNFPNERVMLLDDEGKEIVCPLQVGNICVSGTALALGYYYNEEKTSEAFVENPTVKGYKELMYQTGDLGEYNDLGELVFKGRRDFQIKFQGHRIELEEIEKAMMAFEEVLRACVLFDEEKSKLYGFYVGDIDSKVLYAKMKEILPIYMVPTKLLKMEAFPMTKNGKTDRRALMESVK